MAKWLLVLFLLVSPLISFGKTYELPSGKIITIEEPKYTWVEKIFILPSGYIWREIIQVAKAQIIPSYIWDNYPELKRVCSCESWWSPNGEPRQFREDGSILWGQDKNGKIIERDVGACQINTIAHSSELKRLKLDVVNSFTDNVVFARLLYDRAGLKPWEASKQCWK